ncbi:hypothetical protein [Streptomyces sp. NBC_01767]|uniref:hypothetical protein n=1 Tax=Streptomyces sp. NBC_01767 TaxID=2975937 RepID=UPI00225092B3|nr:hypothetical protein [Streptomyces sp. NBC_01767]MCX4393505.1 hypothetical protein [Streptomyces sp. NBC_01767]
MSDEKQPELTPKEQRAQDQQRVQNQLIVTDVNRQVQDVMDLFPFGGSGNSGRTSFEGFDLNAMVDLIENSNPEHLEHAGEALLTARRAIAKAANELGDFIKDVDWEGESGTAFRDWGTGLVAHALKLGDFAETTGIQITVAGTGLASVRKSLPPRDSRLVRKSVDEIETPKRVEGNPEYAAALKVEKDRQEAINQANRLASYYAVSEETLAAQAPPRFEKKLDVAMPRPLGRIEKEREPGVSSAGSEALGNNTPRGHAERAATVGVGTSGGTGNRAAIEGLGTAPTPDTSTSTEIDSVKAPPAPVTLPDTSPAPPTANPTGPSTGPNPPMVNEFVKPVAGGSRRSMPPTGLPRTIGQPGRNGPTSSGPTTTGPTTTGRTGVPVGRPAPIGGGPGSGTPGRPGGGGSQPPAAGRTSVTGGRPMAGGPANASKSPGPRTGRARAIVGGTPQRTAPGTESAGGTRGVPRGTVIGAGGTNAATRPGGRGTPSSKGVVGTPRSAAGTGSGSRGFTAGGAGLVRGPAGRRDSDDEDQDGGAARPDYLVEDRETWEAGRRGVAPPVIE